MAKALDVWIVESDEQEKRLVLKGTPQPDQFWIEIYHLKNGVMVKKTEVVSDWGNVPQLLLNQDWLSYDTTYVEPMFSKLIHEFRSSTNTLPKYSPQERILEIFDRFRTDKKLHMKRFAEDYSVSEDTVLRDIKVLRYYFTIKNKKIVYYKDRNIYRLEDGSDDKKRKEIPLNELKPIERILSLYDLFQTNDVIDEEKTVQLYGIGKQQLKRNILTLSQFLQRDDKKIDYDKQTKQYRLVPFIEEV